MAPAEEGENLKSKSKRNKRKKFQTPISTNLVNTDESKDSNKGEVVVELLTTISFKRDKQELHHENLQLQQQPLRQQTQLESQQKQQADQKQRQSPFKDEDDNIAIDLEHQSVLFQVEKILSSTSGHSDLVFVVVRLKPNEPASPVSCIYLGEAQKNSSNVSNLTLRLNNKTIAHVPTERRSSNDLSRIFGAIATLQTSLIYLRHRQQLYSQLIEFYRRLLELSREEFQDLRSLSFFWKQLHLLERYITNTSRFCLATSNPAFYTKRRSRTEKLKMVHEIGPDSTVGQSGVVNSTSLEDVPLSEASDRAQSIQSLHSISETPTPDNTPSFDELQQRLDEYNRHIEQMNEQKNQLLRMHNDAKQHLMLLEQYQRECNERNLSFGDKEQGDNSGDRPPNYDSVDEVQSDMAILAQRVKNISRLVDSQKNLVDQLPGEAAEDMRADQENLEQKLRDIRRNGNDLRMMATELDALNTTAATSQTDSKQDEARVVPIRITTNELGSLKTIEQKEAEIDAMRTQLRRLKEMMGTIETIEAKATSGTSQQMQPNTSTARNVPIRNVGGDALSYMTSHDNDHERTPTPRSSMRNTDLERNLRILQGVSSDVRAQNERMAAEKERIMALQDEISRCSQQAAAAAQLGEDALKRNSVTPTPTPSNFPHDRKSSEHEAYEKSNDELENEYLAKKQEYAAICRRIDELNAPGTQPAVPSNRQQSISKDSRSSIEREFPSRNKANHNPNESTRNVERLTNLETTTSSAIPEASNITGSNLQDDVQADTSSVQSNGSTSQPFSMPPPMTTIGAGPLSWNYPNFRYTQPTSVISPTCAFPPPPATFPMPPFVPAAPPQPASLSVLTGPTSASGLFYSPSHPTPPGTIPTLPPVIGQPLIDQSMLQHCLNQQHVFGQALNQLNSMLWQQQREIDYLHRITQTLQERLIRLGGEALIHPTDMGMGFRSESVPPTFGTSVHPSVTRPPLNMANNIFENMSTNRAQSEQPITNSADANLSSYHQEQHQHQQQHYMQQQQQQQHHQVHQQRQFSSNIGAATGTSGTYSEVQQQQHAVTSATSGGSSTIYSTLNNANVTGRNIRSQVPPSTGQETSGPAPIFMHHHNNAIHQNNANLRRANVHAHTHTQANSNDSTNTLNNQVPPGNRANNYWDNFKSYSRQNLLATHSNKSNEDNQQHQQPDFDVDDNGEYGVENSRAESSEQSVRYKRTQPQPQPGYRLSNEPNTMVPRECSRDFSNRNNKEQMQVRSGNQMRIKNFQQHRQQQPNPLPIGTVITNPLHTNIPSDERNAFDTDTAQHMSMHPTVVTDEQLRAYGYPTNELDDQLTAEIYGCNYEHPSATSASHAGNSVNERNVNFGNSPSNRHGNKVAPKFQYRMGFLTEQSMRMIESFLEHWDDAEAEGNQDIVLNNRQSINRYLRQLHQLQSTLRFDANYLGPSTSSGYIDRNRQRYMRDEYEEEVTDEPLYDDEGRDYENVTVRPGGDINLNNAYPSRFSNITRSVFERNLLVNNRNARKPEKFVKKQTVSGTHRRQFYTYDYGNDENRATFSDSTDQRRGTKNRPTVEWCDEAMIKNIERNQETATIRHAVSESNVTERRRGILDRTPIPEIPHCFPLPTISTGLNVTSEIQENPQQEPSDPTSVKSIDNEPGNPIDENIAYEDMDMGAYSLAAQEHFQKKVMSKDKSKEETTTEKQNIPSNDVSEENTTSDPTESDSKTALSSVVDAEESTRQQRSHIQRNNIHLDSDSRALIDIVTACLRTDLRNIVFVDQTLLLLVAKITASLSQAALMNREFPHYHNALVLLSSSRLFAKIQSEIANMPARLSQFIPWYENYLETLLLDAAIDNLRRADDVERELYRLENAMQLEENQNHQFVVHHVDIIHVRGPTPVNDPSGDEMDLNATDRTSNSPSDGDDGFKIEEPTTSKNDTSGSEQQEISESDKKN